MIWLDGRMNYQAGDLAGLTQAEAERPSSRGSRTEVSSSSARRSPRRGPANGASPDRAADLAAVVVQDGGAAAGDRGAARPRGRFDPTRSTGSRLRPWSRRPTGASRGSSGGDTSCHLDDARRRDDLRGLRGGGAGAGRRGTALTRDPDVLDTWFSSALWPSRRSGGQMRHRTRAVLPGQRQLHCARDHPSVGEPDDLDGARGHGRAPVHRRDHPLDRAGAGRAADVEEPWHRGSTRSRRSTRTGRRRRAMACWGSSTQDVRFFPGAIEEGRKLANKLWNVSG